MKRFPKAGLVPVPPQMKKGDSMRQDARRVLNRASSQKGDWFKIQNVKDEDKTLVYIYDEIGYWGTTASDFVKVLSDIETSEIELHLNSPGGDVFDGVSIYNSLKQHKSDVTVIVDALAASAASFIAQAGDKIIMTRNATMMIHDASAMAWGNAQDMEDAAKLLNKVSDNIADIYAFNAGGTVEEWRALMKEEVWYSAPEAVEAGLAHEMLDADDDEAAEATNQWDLSIFNHKGRSDAPSPAEVRVLISNRVKEASMGKPAPKNTGETPEEESAQPTEAPAEPEAPETDPAENEEEETEPVAQTPAAPSNKGTLFSAKINGSLSSDAVAVQNHIDGLEQFRKETLENARKSFVAQLAKDNKIAATQVDGLEEFALDLTDAQYEKWTASWNAAGSIPLLGQHAGGTSNHAGTGSSPEAEKSAEIEKVKAIVRQHKLSGMPTDQIQKTESYNRLLELEPEYKL